ncbi:hypothetical protein LY76DRAFT_596222 [Colletotrichum caudatum]|nr:hypothetical protein LY76DRAFT_596222 [Colletotrichum caudatum]
MLMGLPRARPPVFTLAACLSVYLSICLSVCLPLCPLPDRRRLAAAAGPSRKRPFGANGV